ncbi:TetR/AcrR family transcriptional regulator [Sporomusa acidovorans]|uniref:Fatty acid metabolism regulator protein n=1 Tax=Sporomusa acidovorans (strain ATCC 49682 / DSM 3132 / Mol) TaxID=1123286 RepID=A0ABZ3J5I4_SPOA4|nr:TetR/AcrR family transcriptional regulator [Sporomusa acidovorans]OZC23930.1 fatty acid metabolism regulator protein [Sporomusa acidovorans DSM 3132]SDF31364.1 transcriptional regulator, TetR family [Sporomusa acidovorans]
MKRQQILDAAYTIFSRKGYHRATVDEIIALADTGKGTVYKYFVNKEQLFYTLIKERSAPFETELTLIASVAEPPLKKIEKAVKVFLEFYVSNADLWRVLMHEMRGLGHEESSNFTEAQRKKYRERFARTIAVLQSIIQEGIERKDIRPCDTNKAAHGLFSVIVMMVFQGFVSDKEDAIKKMAAGITDIFLYGVAEHKKK